MSAEIPDDDPIILFDGVCNLCNGFVQYIAPRDDDERFYYASLQSPAGVELLERHDLPTDELESVVLIEGDDVYVKSGAALRTAYHLGGLYRLLWPFRVLPKRFRNWCYDFVANRRYRWFGKKDQCMMPTGNLQDRFLESGVGPEDD
ncbi:thiol-disulfide oxidoreductase DCC family protein [Natronosalvus vescus]|uniref:thiol-disulfide oxidoreductase DCC family protein n=1 Tax=Natronosalvus vescus TaxID=2953881 RepID=UPI002090A88F|nr:thiol-disulfide oxidoreductase DCC family protein [Natronosalvus vescus]